MLIGLVVLAVILALVVLGLVEYGKGRALERQRWMNAGMDVRTTACDCDGFAWAWPDGANGVKPTHLVFFFSLVITTPQGKSARLFYTWSPFSGGELQETDVVFR